MKDIKNFICESASKKSKYTIKDLKEALDYFETYYDEFPEEKGIYPNWGEIDNFFSNEKWCEALMDGEKDPLVQIVDNIFESLYEDEKKNNDAHHEKV